MNTPGLPPSPPPSAPGGFSTRPALDARLEAVLSLVKAETHADIGTDHARLPVRLVRQGDGFAPIQPGELDSASVAGMGAYTIRGILERAGESLPPALVLQPNDSPLWLRQWARQNGYHLRAEQLLPGYWAYPVLRLERAEGPDPAYAGLPEQAALRYGPLLLREGGELLRAQIEADVERLTPVAAPGRGSWDELAAAREALRVVAGAPPPLGEDRV